MARKAYPETLLGTLLHSAFLMKKLEILKKQCVLYQSAYTLEEIAGTYKRFDARKSRFN